MPPLHSLIIAKVKKLLNDTNIVVICIDGPTAAGKTILAEDLGGIIKKELSINVDFYRLDWTLKKRTSRENDLKGLMNQKEPFYYEGELHMHLHKFKDFLEKIHLLKKNRTDCNSAIKENSLLISSLYSREAKGECVAKHEFNFSSPKTLIICEGHYTSRTEFRNLIDFNICLLADKKELLKRKIDRVKGYRSSDAAIDYFHKIDIPSFSYHISRFHKNIDLLVDNTDYKNPLIISNNKIGDWFYKDLNKFNNEKLINNHFNYEILYESIFSSSKIDRFLNLDQFVRIFNLYKFLDKLISGKLQNDTHQHKNNIQSIVFKELETISEETKTEDIKILFDIVSSSSLYDVYQRKIPVSIGIKIESLNKRYIFVHYNIDINFIEIMFLWDGGSYEIKIQRSLNNLEKNVKEHTFEITNTSLKLLNNEKKLNTFVKVLYSPTDFCIPSFIKDEQFNIVYTGREHELTSIFSICKKVISNSESIFCHRVSQYSELNFFKKFLESCGINCLTISNYLIGINSKDRDLVESFQIWCRHWISVEEINKYDQADYDLEIKKEINEANKIVLDKYTSFILIDGFLFESQKKHNLNDVIIDLRSMLNSSNRIIRKRAFEYIVNDQNGIEINTKEFLAINGIEFEDIEKTTFPLAEMPSFYPSIMAEIYLWLHIRGDASAVLGANVYDINDDQSLDVEAILECASNYETPVVLQSSFNALGQEEYDGDKKYIGYLQLVNGPSKLVDACIKSNIKNVLIKGCSRTFYGIGLDHVDARNDIPNGRAKRFLEMALDTGQVTHVVLDGSHLFKAKDREVKTIKNAYTKVVNYAVSLLETKNDLFLTDLEYCVGEMNYIGDVSNSMIPTAEEIRIFTNLVRQSLITINKGRFNCRPTLFIGNVGTTHHSSDGERIDSTITFDWVDKIKDQNFISAVLHGTTNSDPKILNQSVKGCHKVNVAGDLLKVYQSSLPNRFNKEIRTFGPDSKYQMPEVRKIKSLLKKEEKGLIKDNLKKCTNKILNVINSPKLTSKDLAYFHRSSFKFNSKTIEIILSTFKKSKQKLAKNKLKNINFNDISFSASMIEVPYEDGFMEIAQGLLTSGLKFFHVDVGDGNFISRKFSGIKKLEYLSSLDSQLKLHTHLMVKDPFSLLPNNKSYVDSYIESGTTSLGVHPRSFKNEQSLKDAIEYIRSSGCRPGIVIEVNQSDFKELWNLIRYLEINWVIIMGVPIGYGGQLFQTRSLKKINFLRRMSIEEKLEVFDIEIDGGLTFNNILDCFNSGANIFAGWSIIKDKNLSDILFNYKQLNNQLSI